jgi:hypothetical protein
VRQRYRSGEYVASDEFGQPYHPNLLTFRWGTTLDRLGIEREYTDLAQTASAAGIPMSWVGGRTPFTSSTPGRIHRWSTCPTSCAASAFLATQQERQLQGALRTRDRIGQAKGIIMERFGVNDLRAFEMLGRLSQEQNIKLHDVAQRVIDTRGD